ncbi:flagellar biosynthetic protein FliO [Catenovulum sediminis]|uniref:flagellar biosynthetic protein FliO n=1 Tax=Catenovulum sediminis TaxID=1740262 RepID=UPI00117D0D4F|nr:flagellar biosynthetic protein FliO [Catenovulum sediminis]
MSNRTVPDYINKANNSAMLSDEFILNLLVATTVVSIILIGIYLLVKNNEKFKRWCSKFESTDNKLIQVIGSKQVSANTSLYLVEIANKQYLLTESKGATSSKLQPVNHQLEEQ